MSENNTNFESNQKSTLKSYRKSLIVFWSLFIVGVVGIVFFFSGVSKGVFGFMPSFEELENPKNSLATEMYTVDGELIGKFFYQNRSYVEYQELSPFLVDALIATEDVRFNDHSGIDVRGLGRVVKGLITGDKSAGGGSTISQQLAKMLFPREEFEKKMDIVFRKFSRMGNRSKVRAELH